MDSSDILMCLCLPTDIQWPGNMTRVKPLGVREFLWPLRPVHALCSLFTSTYIYNLSTFLTSDPTFSWWSGICECGQEYASVWSGIYECVLRFMTQLSVVNKTAFICGILELAQPFK